VFDPVDWPLQFGFDDEMSLIHNERTKLTAGALDRASTAFFAVGVLGQAFSLVPSKEGLVSLISILVWFFAAICLHIVSRHVLGSLQE
jgi:hypothetical protein